MKGQNNRKWIILGVISLVACIVGIGFNQIIYSHYSATTQWRWLYALDALLGIGGFVLALVFFGQLLSGKEYGND